MDTSTLTIHRRNAGSFKQKWVFPAASLFIAFLFLVSCMPASTRFPEISLIIVTQVEIGKFPLNEYALLPDGSAVYNVFQDKIILETNETSSSLWGLGLPSTGRLLNLSPNGRYLSGYMTVLDPETRNVGAVVSSIIDLDNQSYENTEYLPMSWSSDSTRYFDDRTLVDIATGETITDWPTTVDFRKIRHTEGNHNYLWDTERNIPVAILWGCLARSEQERFIGHECESGLRSISNNPEDQERSIFEPILTVSYPNKAVDSIFDPTGQYVLLAIWERSSVPGSEFNPQDVTDTVLMLIDWRTKSSTEFMRLSVVDPEHVAGLQGGLQWSADGSTIVVPRVDAGALVLKVRYP